MISKRSAVALVVSCAATVVAKTPLDHAKQWGQWRGPTSNGVADHSDPPVEWSEAENIRWKVQIPGHGLSTPLVWGDAVYLQTAISTDQAAEGEGTVEPKPPKGGGHGMRRSVPSEAHKFVVLALDRNSGKTLWQKTW